MMKRAYLPPAGAAFTVDAGPAGEPSVTRVSPQAGAPGTVVTVTGSNFSASASVLLANTPVAATSATATQITFAVPAGARAGKVAVTASGTPSTNGATFWVTSAAAPKSLGTVGQ